MKVLISIFIFFSLNAFSLDGVVQTSSQYNDDRLYGTGFLFKSGSTKHRICKPQKEICTYNVKKGKKNCRQRKAQECRYFVVSSAHHLDGEQVDLCSNGECYKIKSRKSIPQARIDSSLDVAVFEVEPTIKNKEQIATKLGNNLVFMQENPTLIGRKKTSEGILIENIKSPNVDFIPAMDTRQTVKTTIGDLGDGNLVDSIPYAPKASWVESTKEDKFNKNGKTQISSEKLNKNKLVKNQKPKVKIKRLAVSKRLVGPGWIRPGQSGGPLIGEYTGLLSGDDIPKQVIGITNSYHRFSRSSYFASHDIIDDLVDDLYDGKTGQAGEIFGYPVKWVYDPELELTYRVLEGIDISEYASDGIDKTNASGYLAPAGSSKSGDGANKLVPAGSGKSGDGASKSVPAGSGKSGDGSYQLVPAGSGKSGDGASKSVPAGSGKSGDGSHQLVPAGSGKSGDGSYQLVPAGSGKSGDGSHQLVPAGSGKSGDGSFHLAHCPVTLENASDSEIESMINSADEINKNLQLRWGINYLGKRTYAFHLKDKKSGEELYISADWEALIFLDQFGENYEFSPIGTGQMALDVLRKRMRLKKNQSCKTPKNCSDYGGSKICSRIELKANEAIIQYGIEGKEEHKIVLDKTGNEKGEDVYRPYKENTTEDNIFIDYTSLFHSDLNQVFEVSGEDTETTVKHDFNKGPVIRMSTGTVKEGSNNPLVDLNMNNCKISN